MKDINFDTSVLKERIEESKRSNAFYTKGIEMLQQKYDITNYFPREEFDGLFPGLSEDFKGKLFNQEELTEEDVLREDLEAVDWLIQESLCLIGIGWGIHMLNSNYDEEDVGPYIKFLYAAKEDQSMDYVVRMFGCATMAMDTPPSFNLLTRLAPLTDNEAVHDATSLIFSEFFGDLITRYELAKGGDPVSRVAKHIIPGHDK
jgi:hypothetical protein